MKAMVTLYALAMLTVIGYGLHHAPVWLCSIVGGCFVYFLAHGLLEHIKRPVLAGGER